MVLYNHPKMRDPMVRLRALKQVEKAIGRYQARLDALTAVEVFSFYEKGSLPFERETLVCILRRCRQVRRISPRLHKMLKVYRLADDTVYRVPNGAFSAGIVYCIPSANSPRVATLMRLTVAIGKRYLGQR